jgi:hypothetical protein
MVETNNNFDEFINTRKTKSFSDLLKEKRSEFGLEDDSSESVNAFKSRINAKLEPMRKKATEPLIKTPIKTVKPVVTPVEETPETEMPEGLTENEKKVFMYALKNNKDPEVYLNKLKAHEEKQSFVEMFPEDKTEEVNTFVKWYNKIGDRTGELQRTFERGQRLGANAESLPQKVGITADIATQMAGSVLGSFSDTLMSAIEPVIDAGKTVAKYTPDIVKKYVSKGVEIADDAMGVGIIKDGLSKLANTEAGQEAMRVLAQGYTAATEWAGKSEENRLRAEGALELGLLPLMIGSGMTKKEALTKVDDVIKKFGDDVAKKEVAQKTQQTSKLLMETPLSKKEVTEAYNRMNGDESVFKGVFRTPDSFQKAVADEAKNVIEPKGKLTQNIKLLDGSVKEINKQLTKSLELSGVKGNVSELGDYIKKSYKGTFEENALIQKKYNKAIEAYISNLKDGDNIANFLKKRQATDKNMEWILGDFADRDLKTSLKKEVINDVRQGMNNYIYDKLYEVAPELADGYKTSLKREFLQLTAKESLSKVATQREAIKAPLQKILNFAKTHPWIIGSTLTGGGIGTVLAATPVAILGGALLGAGGIAGGKMLRSRTLKKIISGGIKKFYQVADKLPPGVKKETEEAFKTTMDLFDDDNTYLKGISDKVAYNELKAFSDELAKGQKFLPAPEIDIDEVIPLVKNQFKEMDNIVATTFSPEGVEVATDFAGFINTLPEDEALKLLKQPWFKTKVEKLQEARMALPEAKPQLQAGKESVINLPGKTMSDEVIELPGNVMPDMNIVNKQAIIDNALSKLGITPKANPNKLNLTGGTREVLSKGKPKSKPVIPNPVDEGIINIRQPKAGVRKSFKQPEMAQTKLIEEAKKYTYVDYFIDGMESKYPDIDIDDHLDELFKAWKSVEDSSGVTAYEELKKQPIKGFVRYAEDFNRNTDNFRGGTWYTDKAGSTEILEVMNPREGEVIIGGTKLFNLPNKPKNPLVIKDVSLKEGSFAVINRELEDELPDRWRKAAQELGELIYDSDAGAVEINEKIRNDLRKFKISEKQITAIINSKNTPEAAMDLIISNGLKENGYDSLKLVSRANGGEHLMVFKLASTPKPSKKSLAELMKKRHEFHVKTATMNVTKEFPKKDFNKLIKVVDDIAKQTGFTPKKDITKIKDDLFAQLKKGNKVKGGIYNPEYYIKDGKLTSAGQNLVENQREKINYAVEEYMDDLVKKFDLKGVAPTGKKRLEVEGITLKNPLTKDTKNVKLDSVTKNMEKEAKKPNYMEEYYSKKDGWYTNDRLPRSDYEKEWTAIKDIPDTVIKKGDKVAIVRKTIGNKTETIAILDKPKIEGGFKIETEYNQNLKNFQSPVKSPLIKEAKKYKSAEEFVKSQFASKTTKEGYITVYHNTPARNVDSIIKNGLNAKGGAESNPGYNWLTTKPYVGYGGNTISVQIPKADAIKFKVNDTEILRPGVIKPEDILGVDRMVKTGLFNKESDVIKAMYSKKGGYANMKWTNEFIDSSSLSKTVKDHIKKILNKKVELTDIWNKANKK